MAFDGAAWNEAIPTNSDLANEIDDYMRDIKLGVRGRANREHVWPSSQAGTSEGGHHRYVTFQAQTSQPTLPTSGVGVLWFDTSNHAFVSDSAGNDYMIVKSGAGITFFGGTGAIGDIITVTSGGGVQALAAATSGWVLTAAGTTATPAWAAAASNASSLVTVGTSEIVVRGTGTAGASGTTNISFSTNFADTAYTVVVSIEDIGGATDPDRALTVRAKSVGTMTIFNGNGGAVGLAYVAVGSKG